MKILKLYDYNDTNSIDRVTADIEIKCGFLWLKRKSVTIKLHRNCGVFWNIMDGTYTDASFGKNIDGAVSSNMDRLLAGEVVSLV